MIFIKHLYAIMLKLISLFSGVDNAKKFDTSLRFKRKLDLKNPKSLADKVSYLELHETNVLISECTDKWEVREYIKGKGYGHILVPTVGGPWNDWNQIEWDRLPASFVLKATHGCKMNYIVKEKNDVDLRDCKREVDHWLNTTYGTYSMEPHYYPIQHRFYAEKYLGDISKLIDYKFHCINGTPEFILVVTDRKSDGDKAMEVKLHLFDVNWNPIHEVTGYGGEKAGDCKIRKPKHYDQMLEISRNLSKDFKFVRVDLYDTDDGIMFGELTFSPAASVFPYLSEEFLISEGSKLKI